MTDQKFWWRDEARWQELHNSPGFYQKSIEEQLEMEEECYTPEFKAMIKENDEIMAQIKAGNCSDVELISFLNKHNRFIFSNALIVLLRRRNKSSELAQALVEQFSTTGDWTIYASEIGIRHFAAAALFLIDTEESRSIYNALFTQVDNKEKNRIQDAIIILKDSVENPMP